MPVKGIAKAVYLVRNGLPWYCGDVLKAERGVSTARWLRKHLYVLLPCLVLLVYAAPSLPYMLPAHRSYQGEDYQPVKALKFWKTLGGEFHKYGPMTDILLGPGYALSMGYWWATGSFERPSSEYPYGFSRPLQQMGFLLLQGRLLFLLLVLLACASMMRALHEASFSRSTVATGFLLCFGSTWVAAYYSPNTRPEAPQYAFVALALACYVRMLYVQPTWRRAAWMSAWAALAVTAKELAATVFVLPYAGLAAWLFWSSRRDPGLARRFWPILFAGLGSGVLTYALFNIVYAPLVWWQRIGHWLFGAGIDAGVWGGFGSGRVTGGEFAVQVIEALLSALGPGGFAFVCVTLLALLVLRPRHWLLMLLPFFSLMLFGLIPLGYVGDRFYGAACVTLVLPGVAGLAALWSGLGGMARQAFAAVLGALLVSNLIAVTLSWHVLHKQADYVIEADLRAERLSKDKLLWQLDVFRGLPGSSRLGLLGYRVDARSLQEIADSPLDTRPDRIYAPEGGLKFLYEARDELPARAEMLRESGFRAEDFRGIEAMGYRLRKRLQPSTPWWFPFDFMQAVHYETWVNRVLVFDKGAAR